jgi:hypothetical protein
MFNHRNAEKGNEMIKRFEIHYEDRVQLVEAIDFAQARKFAQEGWIEIKEYNGEIFSWIFEDENYIGDEK